MEYPDAYKTHGVTHGHARAWNSVLECNGRSSPTFNYRGSYSTGSYAGTLCIVALRKVGVGPRKAAAASCENRNVPRIVSEVAASYNFAHIYRPLLSQRFDWTVNSFVRWNPRL